MFGKGAPTKARSAFDVNTSTVITRHQGRSQKSYGFKTDIPIFLKERIDLQVPWERPRFRAQQSDTDQQKPAKSGGKSIHNMQRAMSFALRGCL
jgi:hypothetical protein